MGKTLYLECGSGISGDMVVAALLDLGANEDGLRRALASLRVDGFDIAVTRKQVAGIDACDFDVVLDEAHESHDHDMDYLYGGLDDADDAEHDEQEHEEDAHDRDLVHHRHKHGHKHHKHGHKRLRKSDKHGHKHGHKHDDALVHDHDHDHEHHHNHDHDHHHHEHRGPADIAAIIDAADLAPRAKATAHRIFDIVAQAEAQAHGLPLEEVHFHEVGAVDSIVDVVAAAYCLDELDVSDVCVSALAEGTGRVRCAHGVLSVPVPAVTNIVAAHGLTLEQRDQQGELVTPTGAAIAAAVRTCELPAAYRILKVGIGAGKRAYDPPSTVRAFVIEEAAASQPQEEAQSLQPQPEAEPVSAPMPPVAGAPVPEGVADDELATLQSESASPDECASLQEVAPSTGSTTTEEAATSTEPASAEEAAAPAEPVSSTETASSTYSATATDVLGTPDLWKLETEVDDCTGEALGFVSSLLYDAGALEVHYLPVFMKKGRPGYQIEALCDAEHISCLETILFEHTTTIGVRRCPEWRTALPRDARELQTAYGVMRAKQVVLPDGSLRTYLEHDSVAQIAQSASISYQEALRAGYAALSE